MFFVPRFLRPSLLLAIACNALLLSPAQAFWPFGDDGMDYTIQFEGADDEMQAWLKELSLDKRTQVNPPQNLDELEVEASTLSDKVRKALQAKGYMEAVVEPRVDKQAEPLVVHILVDQEHRYPVASITLQWPGEPLQAIDLAMLQSKQGAPVDVRAIEHDTVMIQDIIAKEHCLLSLSVTPKLQLFSKSRDARIIFTIQHGPQADFGVTTIKGNEHLKDKVIERAIQWKPGECYSQAKIDATRTSLIESRLLATVEIVTAEAPQADGRVPMSIAVKERVARSVGAGVRYSTDQGMGVYGNWEHRNLLGGAEKFNTDLLLAERQQGLKNTLRVPAFLHDSQVLVLSADARREILDAYEALTLEANAGLERQLAKKLKGGVGVGYTLSQTEDARTGTNKYALLSLPSFLEYDTRNDVMDPREGLLARLSGTPYTETIGDGGRFLKMQVTGQHYMSSDSLPLRPTLATRVSLGAIYGGKGDDVPADIRYYAGGGGSVRGYSYQSLSPYFLGDPIGGSSLLETSAELRMRFTEDFGGVVFVDAGNAYASATPDLSQELYVGTGLGVRYYSPVGPLRFDIAFPLNGDKIGEDTYQFYVSLGQAF